MATDTTDRHDRSTTRGSAVKHTGGEWRLHHAGSGILEIQTVGGTPIVAWLGFDGLSQPRKEVASNAKILALAPFAPHECEDAECPGRKLLDLLRRVATMVAFDDVQSDARTSARALLAKLEAHPGR